MNKFEIALNFKFADGERVFNLEKRLINGLKDNNITHLGYLVGFDFEVFKKFRNFGIKSIKQLENFLREIGFESEVEVHGWFHDERLEADAFSIISNTLLESKKISDYLSIDEKEKIIVQKEIKEKSIKEMEEKRERHLQEMKKQFLDNYSLNEFVINFKNYFKDEYNGLNREGEIIKLRYFEGLKLQEIADKYNVSRERIRQIIERKLRQFKRYAFLNKIFLKDFLDKEKKNIWLILVQDQENKNILVKKKLKNNLFEYKKSNKNGLYDLLIKIYYGYLKNFIRKNYIESHEYVIFEDKLV